MPSDDQHVKSPPPPSTAPRPVNAHAWADLVIEDPDADPRDRRLAIAILTDETGRWVGRQIVPPSVRPPAPRPLAPPSYRIQRTKPKLWGSS